MADNTLYYGDNLDILRRYTPDESVDLVHEVLTVGELLDGAEIGYPPITGGITYNQAPKYRDQTAEQLQLGGTVLDSH